MFYNAHRNEYITSRIKAVNLSHYARHISAHSLNRYWPWEACLQLSVLTHRRWIQDWCLQCSDRLYRTKDKIQKIHSPSPPLCLSCDAYLENKEALFSRLHNFKTNHYHFPVTILQPTYTGYKLIESEVTL